MPITDNLALIEASVTPQDTNVAGDMSAFIKGVLPGYGFYFQVYAATLPDFYSQTKLALQRGVVTKGLFDHIQGEGATEKPLLVPFIDSMPHDNFGVGTSPKGKQLLHDKKLLGNVPLSPQQDAAALGLPPYPPSRTWVQALADGYPVAWVGSWNISPAASLQANTTLVIVSARLVLYFRDLFLANLAYVQAYEPNLETVKEALTSGNETLLGPVGGS